LRIGLQTASLLNLGGTSVAPDGDISCDADAYVGVWDITNKERVIVDQTQTTAEHECDALFGKKSD
ncbi:hypothetical protein, partial [Stenotrophomonas sp.]|uniref:hypothetical protein n=1 Tax=Stenotrophomonas sp. TaxID=69392 RepID=UPI0028AFBC49